jgi:Outer membrane protein beta-barrel domain
MKKRVLNSGVKFLLGGFIVFGLYSCSCMNLCTTFRFQQSIKGNKTGTDCDCYCKNETGAACTEFFSVKGTSPENPNTPGAGKQPGEYFSTIITAGPVLSFKSSNEDYGGSYGKHKPGIGLNIGVGTVLPFNKNWAVAPAIRITQKNASEELGYSDPGGGGMKFTDKYSYNYLGATMLAQYRAGKHVSIVAGPEVNFLVASSLKNGGSSGTGEKQSISKSSNKLGLDLLAGIKFEIPAKNSRSKWGVQLMYDHRLSRLNKKKDDTGQDAAAYKMKSVQLGLAYNICGSCGKKK